MTKQNSPSSKAKVPFRQIRALYDDETITVYQAYSSEIARAAVAAQKLDASPEYLFTRMTWIKPSWCWMMYRSGYGRKDNRQTNILALKIRHADFQHILSRASVCSSVPMTTQQRQEGVSVQWDPERSPSIGRLEHRSIQIGIKPEPGPLRQFVDEWIVAIEDVTERARALEQEMQSVKQANKMTSVENLIELGLMPNERVYELPEELREILNMDETQLTSIGKNQDRPL